MIEAKKLKYVERKNLPDSAFALIQTVKDKRTGKPRKIRRFPIHDKAHVRNALARAPQALKAGTITRAEYNTIVRKCLAKARKLGMTQLLKRHKKKASLDVEEVLLNPESSDEEFEAALEALNAALVERVTTREYYNKVIEKVREIIDAGRGIVVKRYVTRTNSGGDKEVSETKQIAKTAEEQVASLKEELKLLQEKLDKTEKGYADYKKEIETAKLLEARIAELKDIVEVTDEVKAQIKEMSDEQFKIYRLESELAKEKATKKEEPKAEEKEKKANKIPTGGKPKEEVKSSTEIIAEKL